jgi:hypothetical protein
VLLIVQIYLIFVKSLISDLEERKAVVLQKKKEKFVSVTEQCNLLDEWFLFLRTSSFHSHCSHINMINTDNMDNWKETMEKLLANNVKFYRWCVNFWWSNIKLRQSNMKFRQT